MTTEILKKLDGTRRAVVNGYAFACCHFDLDLFTTKSNQHVYRVPKTSVTNIV